MHNTLGVMEQDENRLLKDNLCQSDSENYVFLVVRALLTQLNPFESVPECKHSSPLPKRFI